MIFSHAGLTKLETVWDYVYPGSVLDLHRVTKTLRNSDGTQVKVYLAGSGWTEWYPVTDPVNIYV